MQSQPLHSQTVADASPATASELAATSFNEVRKTSNIVMDGIQTLNNDIGSLENRMQQIQAQIQTLKVGLFPLKLGVPESRNSMENPSLNQISSGEHPTIVDENIDGTQRTSYDGTYVWKITNFKEKMST